MDESWARKPRRIGKLLFEENERGSTHFDVWDNYGNKVGSGTGFTVRDAMVEVIEIAYELHAGEYEHVSKGIVSRHNMVNSEKFNKKHGKLKLK